MLVMIITQHLSESVQFGYCFSYLRHAGSFDMNICFKVLLHSVEQLWRYSASGTASLLTLLVFCVLWHHGRSI